MQELFSQLEIEHPNLFNTNTLDGRKFINDYYKFFELEKEQINNAINYDRPNLCCWTDNSAFEEYYDETFKIEKL